MSPRSTRYRVLIYTWDCYKIFLEAASPEAAEEKAEDLFNGVGPEAFTHWDNGTDEIVVDVVAEPAK